MSKNNGLSLVEELQSITDDLRLSIVDSDATILELKKLSTKSPRTTRATRASSGKAELNQQTAELVCLAMEEYKALVENKIGSHPKTTMEDKEGMADFLTYIWSLAGRKGEFKSFRNSILIPV